jgi:hypothetical protein
MTKKSMLKEAAQREVNAGRLNPDAVKDLIQLAKKRVEVIGEGPTAIYKIGGEDINVGLGRMIDKRPYFQPITAANGNNNNNNNNNSSNNTAASQGSNPFAKLINKRGVRDPAIEKHIAGMITAMGTKKVADIARAAVSADAPFGRTLTGLPLTK